MDRQEFESGILKLAAQHPGLGDAVDLLANRTQALIGSMELRLLERLDALLGLQTTVAELAERMTTLERREQLHYDELTLQFAALRAEFERRLPKDGGQ